MCLSNLGPTVLELLMVILKNELKQKLDFLSFWRHARIPFWSLQVTISIRAPKTSRFSRFVKIGCIVITQKVVLEFEQLQISGDRQYYNPESGTDRSFDSAQHFFVLSKKSISRFSPKIDNYLFKNNIAAAGENFEIYSLFLSKSFASIFSIFFPDPPEKVVYIVIFSFAILVVFSVAI